jgi:hypothetical protein
MQVAKWGTGPNRQRPDSTNRGARERTNWAEDGPRKIGSQAKRRQQDNPTMPLGEIKEGRNDECREGKVKFAMHPQPGSSSILSCAENPTVRNQSARNRGGEMAASSSSNLTMEERLKLMDAALESLKQTLQYQLDFLENLDSEAGRRLEQLEQDISTVKFGFTEELSKLHQELKNPKDEFEERIGQLEGKMSKLNIEWRKDPKE